MVDIDHYTKIEEPINDYIETFEDVQQLVKATLNNTNYKNNKIRVFLTKKADVRRTYLALISLNSCRVGELMEHTYVTRRTLYSHLYKLINLGLVKKVSIMDLFDKKSKKTPEERHILKRFKDWISRMNKGMQQYYKAKTNYFSLTESGKNIGFIEWAIRKEKEMKGDEE